MTVMAPAVVHSIFHLPDGRVLRAFNSDLRKGGHIVESFSMPNNTTVNILLDGLSEIPRYELRLKNQHLVFDACELTAGKRHPEIPHYYLSKLVSSRVWRE